MLTQSQLNTLAVRGFALLNFLDDGTFATVISAHDSSRNGLIVAIKILDKEVILKAKKRQAVMTEKAVLTALEHVNVLSLLETFQDDFTLCKVERNVAFSNVCCRFRSGMV